MRTGKYLLLAGIVLLVVTLFIICMPGSEETSTDNMIKATSWEKTTLRDVPVNYRTDGYSQYYHPNPPLNKEQLEQTMVDPLVKGGFAAIEWGINAGSSLTYDTKVGQLVGQKVTEEQWKKMRKGDHRVYQNLWALIDSGVCPLEAAINRAHKSKVKVFGHIHLNKEYSPEGSWASMLFTDEFSSSHKEYRIPGRLLLDFKYKEVRDRKLAILREVAEKGSDGLMVDFVSHPIFFQDSKSGKAIMTEFIRDVRKMLDEVGEAQNRKIELMVRVIYGDGENGECLDWKLWMREGLIDIISAFKPYPSGEYFDIRMDDFVAYRDKIESNCKVYGHVWQALGIVDTDTSPTGAKRYSKPKTVGMYRAQALIHNRVGCDGLELGFASPQQWRSHLSELGTISKIEFADKHYMVDIKPYMPVIFENSGTGKPVIRKKLPLRVADDIKKAVQAGFDVKTEIILTCRSLKKNEKLEFFVNGKGPVLITAATLQEQNTDTAVNSSSIEKNRARNHQSENNTSFLNQPNWWEKGKKVIEFPAEWLKLGDNELELVYSTDSKGDAEKLEIMWVELTLDYKK